MQVSRGIPLTGRATGTPSSATGAALTIGNFDGVHQGHQAMLERLKTEARQRGLPSCVLSFEPHPRDYFAHLAGKPEQAPARISTLRDKLLALQQCGVDRVVVQRFDARLAGLSAQDFVDQVLVRGLGMRWVLVGDDFRFGARRAGDFAMLSAAGARQGFAVARLPSHAEQGQRVSSSAVREALVVGDLARAALLLGRPYAISGRVVHGQKLGRTLGFRTLNLRFGHHRPAAMGIFVVRVDGLGGAPLAGVASLGVRPTVVDAGRVLLEVHCLDWPASLGAEAGYGQHLCVSLLHKLHDERKYPGLDALRAGIAQDTADARAWWAANPARLGA